MLTLRKPAVAGQFYSGTSSALLKQVAGYVNETQEKEQVKAIISPHAGLMYSGSVAGSVYSRIAMPDTFILIGPNHTGLGKHVSMMTSGAWEIPTGLVTIDTELAERIFTLSSEFSKDDEAHYYEHSLEVQLPFIRYFSENVKIVPITMFTTSLKDCQRVGESLAKAVSQTPYPVVIAASSDMSHYVSDTVAREKDKKAIERILSLDPEGLFNDVRQYGISMCGYGPSTAMLYAAKALGATHAELVKYMTSGDVSGDYSHVVGYAGIIVK
ncbi:MAG TPA: AmmeMemoRadiSam system protein B [Thermodesulfovibrionia bacterium]|nr:AmmeMemoRadiSam system protein B [Thermodesulfovibrionia bacterium]